MSERCRLERKVKHTLFCWHCCVLLPRGSGDGRVNWAPQVCLPDYCNGSIHWTKAFQLQILCTAGCGCWSLGMQNVEASVKNREEKAFEMVQGILHSTSFSWASSLEFLFSCFPKVPLYLSLVQASTCQLEVAWLFPAPWWDLSKPHSFSSCLLNFGTKGTEQRKAPKSGIEPGSQRRCRRH